MSSVKHLNITVAGRVQGVFYRDSTKKEADRLGIKGFVRNEPDGTVYIEAEAEGRALENFIEWCGHGPAYAHVEKLNAEFSALRNYVRFSVRY